MARNCGRTDLRRDLLGLDIFEHYRCVITAKFESQALQSASRIFDHSLTG